MAIDKLYFDSSPVTASNSYHEVGLSDAAKTAATGLSATTQYYFKVDGTEYDITTGTDVTFDAVIELLNTALSATNVSFSIESGDLRATSSNAAVALTAGSSGANLFANFTTWSAFDTAVPNVFTYTFQSPTDRAILKQIRINFPILYTGKVEWKLDKTTGSNYDQTFESSSLSGVSTYYNTGLELYSQSGDKIIVRSTAACAGTSHIELTFMSTGY